MILFNCPRCDEDFRVPTGEIPEDAFGECPWCREVFPIAEVVEKLPPVLQVLSADGQPLNIQASAVAAAAGFAAGPDVGPVPTEASPMSDDGSLYSESQPLYDQNEGFDDTVSTTDETAPAESWASEHDEDVENLVAEEQEDEGAQWSDEEAQQWSHEESADDEAISPMKVSPARARSKKKGSPIKTLIAIAMGPVIALPLAGGILLAIGKAPDLGFYPFDGSFTEAGKTRTFASQPSGARGSSPTKATGRSLSTDLSDPGPEPAITTLDDITKPAADQDSTDATDLTVIPPGILNDSSAPDTKDTELAMPDQAVNLKPPVVAPPIADPGAATSSVGIASTDESGGGDSAIDDATSNASTMLGQLINFQGPEGKRRSLLAQTYAAIAAVGVSASGKDANVEKLVARIAQSPLLDDLGAAAPQWLTYKKRTTEGILLIGSPDEDGDAPSITLGSGVSVSITGSDKLPDAERILGLGRIIKSPTGQSVELVVAEPLP